MDTLPMAQCCAPLLDGTMAPERAETMARVLKALADPARLRIVNLISAQASGEVCQCEFTEPLGLSQPTVSHHLKILRESGLVEVERRGSWAYYRLATDELRTLTDALAPTAQV